MIGSMSIIGNKSRLGRYVGASKRFLLKARDLYIDILVNFDGKVGGAASTHMPHPAKSFSRSKQDVGKQMDVDELYRSISRKCNWRDMEFEGYFRVERSYSMAIGKIGTIYEEEPCNFYESVKSEVLFPRSRSLAVTRSNVYC